METRSEKGERFEILNRTFSLDLLLDMILNFVVHDENKDQAISNIRSCRLVNQNWLRSVSRVLLHCKEPLFRLSFDSKTNNEIVEFISTVSRPSGLYNRVPPFEVTANTKRGYQFKDKRQIFHDCLVHCGSGLVSLCLTLGKDFSFLADANAEILFPNLGMFKVTVGNSREWRRNNMYINFIQTALHACRKLKSFKILNYCAGPNIRLPTNLQFPSTITELTLVNSLPDDNLELLESILVPSLKRLTLEVQQTPRKDGIITSILEKCGETLQDFNFRCWADGDDKKSTTFRLPLMEKLNSLKIVTPYLELEQNLSHLEQHVPLLSRMDLSNQTVSAFLKWTDGSCFRSVTSLQASLSSLEVYTENVGPGVQYNVEINFDACLMENIKRAFPNLRQLGITIYDGDTTVVKFIMKEMRSLQHLRIFAHVSRNGRLYVHPNFWDALLLGIPIESVAALRKSPELWEHLLKESTVSIRNMTDLQKLYISSIYRGRNDFSWGCDLSSALFTHGFLKMPNLTELDLESYLRVPNKSIEAWRKQNRLITCRYYDDTDSGSVII